MTKLKLLHFKRFNFCPTPAPLYLFYRNVTLVLLDIPFINKSIYSFMQQLTYLSHNISQEQRKHNLQENDSSYLK